eukprot:5771240-Pleurochrysis_carterae.AAC.1
MNGNQPTYRRVEDEGARPWRDSWTVPKIWKHGRRMYQRRRRRSVVGHMKRQGRPYREGSQVEWAVSRSGCIRESRHSRASADAPQTRHPRSSG